MKKAGVDVGCTTMKVAYETPHGWEFLNSAETPTLVIVERLRRNGVRQLNVAGIGRLTVASPTDFKIKRAEGDQIQCEINLQANGARKLLAVEKNPTDEFLLVSIGTGTSYTFITKERIERFPIGNSIGGGFLIGLAVQLGLKDSLWGPSVNHLRQAFGYDLRVQDVIEETRRTPLGQLIIANFGKAYTKLGSDPWEIENLQKTLLNTVATAVVRDIALFNLMPNLPKPGKVVFIGYPVQQSRTLRDLLSDYCAAFVGIQPIFPLHAAYALAVGSYFMEETELDH